MNNDENISPRFISLGEKLKEWLNQYPDEEFDEKQGIDLIVLGHDEKYNGRIAYTLLSEKNPINSIFNAYNHGLGQVFENDHILEQEIFYGILDWYAQLFAEHPKFFDQFQDAINFYIDRNKKLEELENEQA